MSQLGLLAPKFPFVRASILKPLLDHLASDPATLRRLLRHVGLHESLFADSYTPVPLAAYLRLFEEISLWTGDSHLGARLGFEIRPGDLAPNSLLVSQASTIRRGLAAIARHTAAYQSETSIILQDEGEDRLILSYLITSRINAPLKQDAEFSLASICQLIRSAVGASWRPIEVHFRHADPHINGYSPLPGLFRAPVLFEQATNCIVMSATEADRPRRTEDPDLIAIMERHLADLSLDTQNGPGVTDKVEQLIAMGLGVLPVTLEMLAAAMQTSPRSLQRSLAVEGQSFGALLKRYRLSRADQLLDEGICSIDTIAATLSYSEGTTFWRAYRSWTGESPSARRTRGGPPLGMRHR
jgi:AraC-like DNA-binding protein